MKPSILFIKKCLYSLLIVCCVSNAIAKNSSSAPSAILVSTQPVSTEFDAKEIQVPGTIRAPKNTILKAEAEGRIITINVHSGQMVNTGQVLVQINPSGLIGQLKSAQADLALKQITFKRNQSLFADKGLSAEDKDIAKTDFLKAQALVEQLQAEFDNTIIKAPFTGQIGLMQVSLGDYVTPGTPIVSITDSQNLEVNFSVAENDIHAVHLNDKATIYSSNQQLLATGAIFALENQLDTNTRSLAGRILITKIVKPLLPGQFVMVHIQTSTPARSIFIPQIAVSYSPEGNYVYRAIHGKAVKTFIKLGEAKGNNIKVVQGLTFQDIIIIAGQQKLQDGSPIQIK